MIPLLAIAAMAAVYRIDSRPDAGVSIHPQDLNGLDRRIGLMEQRFYAVEAKVNRLEQQVAYPRTPSASPDLRELESIRSQIQLLQRRVAELDCGLVKLDERTLTPAAREGRKTSDSTDPCRSNPGAPLKPSSRP